MKDLSIVGTQQTPTVEFKTNGNLLIEGISLPENVYTFYGSVFEWLEEFGDNLPQAITVTLDIEYSNTASSVIILKLLRKLVTFANGGIKLKIIWKYNVDDEDVYDEGQKFQSLAMFDFEFVEK